MYSKVIDDQLIKFEGLVESVENVMEGHPETDVLPQLQELLKSELQSINQFMLSLKDVFTKVHQVFQNCSLIATSLEIESSLSTFWQSIATNCDIPVKKYLTCFYIIGYIFYEGELVNRLQGLFGGNDKSEEEEDHDILFNPRFPGNPINVQLNDLSPSL